MLHNFSLVYIIYVYVHTIYIHTHIYIYICILDLSGVRPRVSPFWQIHRASTANPLYHFPESALRFGPSTQLNHHRYITIYGWTSYHPAAEFLWGCRTMYAVMEIHQTNARAFLPCFSINAAPSLQLLRGSLQIQLRWSVFRNPQSWDIFTLKFELHSINVVYKISGMWKVGQNEPMGQNTVLGVK